jgi:hypothetical protein
MRSADRRRRFLLGAAAVAFALFALLAFATSWAALAAGWFVSKSACWRSSSILRMRDAGHILHH